LRQGKNILMQEIKKNRKIILKFFAAQSESRISAPFYTSKTV
jgi:hypothetical protein